MGCLAESGAQASQPGELWGGAVQAGNHCGVVSPSCGVPLSYNGTLYNNRIERVATTPATKICLRQC